jgi:predicted TIM-barrel fold metal-dependent hydrolase
MSTPTGLIDVHSHHYPDAYLDACQRPDSGFTHYYRDDGRLIVLQDGAVGLAVPQPLPPPEHRIQLMDEAGVEVQVLSVSAPNVFRFPEALRIPLARDLNDELSDLAAGSGGRLKVFVSLPLPAVDAALEELDRALALPQVVGVVVCSNIDRVNLDDERFSPVWEELSRRRTTVFCHPTVPCCADGLREYAMSLAMGFMAENMFAVGRLAYAGTFDRFPGIRWIFTHLGGTIPFVLPRYDNYYRQFPECREHISRPPSEILRELYYDTCTMHAPALRCAVDTLGAERLLFGSDYPHVPGGIDRFVNVLSSIGLSPEELAMIGRRTAAGLLGLEDRAAQTVQVAEP